MIEELRTATDGTQYFRVSHGFKQDSQLTEFGNDLRQLCEPSDNRTGTRVLIENSIANVISWLWADYALLPKQYFTCEHPYDKDGERFYLSAFEDCFDDETTEYLSREVGIPMWAELSIEYIDLVNTTLDVTLEENWGNQNFVSDWGKSEFLSSEGSAIALIYALENSSDGDLIVNTKIADVHKALIQSDPNWYHDQWTYYNWLNFEVTVDKKEIERELKLIGASYSSLTEVERNNLALAAIEAMKIEELEKDKVPQYLLSLLLNHPKTSDQAKTQIALTADEHIIKLKD